MKKLLGLVLVMLLVLSPMCAFAEGITAAMVTDTGGVNDRSFNQNVWEGLKLAETDFGAKVSYMQSTQESDYAPILETLLDQGNDIIFGVGFLMGDAVKEAAANHPDTKYVCVDYGYGDSGSDNLIGLSFREEEPGFLAGYVAGKMSMTAKIGFVGGMAVPAVVAYEWGYVAGAKYANPDIEVFQQYANSFNDAALGKSIATQMYDNGCDVVFMCGGTMGLGGIEAAKEKNKFVIGVDVDQSYLAPDQMITSAMKFLDVAAMGLVAEAMEGTFKGGDMVVGLKESMAGLPDSTSNLVPSQITDDVATIIEKIISGEIKVPRTEDEAKELGYAK